MKFLVALLLALTCTAAHADELIVGHVSKHFNSDEKMRERNPGLGYKTEVMGYHVQAGFYRNSYDRDTQYVLADVYEQPLLGKLSVRVLAGVVNGYSSGPRPFIFPMLAYPLTDKITLDTIVVPPVTGTTVFAFSLRYKVN